MNSFLTLIISNTIHYVLVNIFTTLWSFAVFFFYFYVHIAPRSSYRSKAVKIIAATQPTMMKSQKEWETTVKIKSFYHTKKDCFTIECYGSVAPNEKKYKPRVLYHLFFCALFHVILILLKSSFSYNSLISNITTQ